MEKDGGKVIGIPCNIPSVYISKSVIDGLADIISWRVVPKSTSSDLNSTEVQMDEIDSESWEALSTACLEGNQQVAMAWHAPTPPPFLKIIFDVFMLMPYMLRHSNWEKDIIDLFKARVA
jgi:hypothetical protein